MIEPAHLNLEDLVAVDGVTPEQLGPLLATNQIVLTDTIPLTPEKQLPNIVVQSVAPLIAETIKRIHHNESVSVLFE